MSVNIAFLAQNFLRQEIKKCNFYLAFFDIFMFLSHFYIGMNKIR